MSEMSYAVNVMNNEMHQQLYKPNWSIKRQVDSIFYILTVLVDSYWQNASKIVIVAVCMYVCMNVKIT